MVDGVGCGLNPIFVTISMTEEIGLTQLGLRVQCG